MSRVTDDRYFSFTFLMDVYRLSVIRIVFLLLRIYNNLGEDDEKGKYFASNRCLSISGFPRIHYLDHLRIATLSAHSTFQLSIVVNRSCKHVKSRRKRTRKFQMNFSENFKNSSPKQLGESR